MLALDGLTNLVSSIGTDKDKARASGWAVNLRTPDAFEAIYRSSAFGRKLIDIPTADMMRRWRGWNGEAKFVEAFEAAERKHRVRHHVGRAHRWARLHGSAAIIIGVRDRLGRSNEPLDVGRMQRGDLAYLHVDIHPRMQIHSWDADLDSPTFGQAATYLYTPVVRGGLNGAQAVIHASRVIPFSGMPLPALAAQSTTEWGDSVFTALEDVLTTAGTTTAVIASMLHEAKVDVIKADLSGVGTPDGEARIRARFALASMLKSVNNTLLLGSGEEYDRKTFSFSGLPDIHIRMLQELCGAADIPATRFLGQSPSGLQATGDSDLRNYYDSLAAKQEDELREPVERLDAIVMASEGIQRDPKAWFFWHPLWQETPTQKAENALKRAQATKMLVETQLVPDEVMRPALVSQLIEAGDYPALETEMAAYQAQGRTAEDNIVEAAEITADAAPRTLHLYRKVENAAEIIAWAKAQGIPNLVPGNTLHVTVAYSRALVDWFALGTDSDKIAVPRGGPRQMERFGDAVVLLFSDWSLNWRHESLCERGCSWEHESYQSHITLTWDADGFDLSAVQPYQGKILLGPEIFAEIQGVDSVA